MPRLFSLGYCTADISVYSRGTCFRTNSDYEDYDTCTIEVEEDIELEVLSFETEATYDYLWVNGVGYSGDIGPDGVFVEEGEEIHFSADFSNTDPGFNICGSPSTGPSDSDSSWFGFIWFVLISAFVLICACVFFCKRISRKPNERVVQVREGRRQRRQEPEDGEVGGLSERYLAAQQSVEGAIEVIEIWQEADEDRDVPLPRPIIKGQSLDDVRPVYTFSEEDHPIPLFDTEREVLDNPLDQDPVSPNQESEEHFELAPPALAPPDLAPAELAPPDYKEYQLPPDYDEVEESEGVKGYEIK